MLARFRVVQQVVDAIDGLLQSHHAIVQIREQFVRGRAQLGDQSP